MKADHEPLFKASIWNFGFALLLFLLGSRPLLLFLRLAGFKMSRLFFHHQHHPLDFFFLPVPAADLAPPRPTLALFQILVFSRNTAHYSCLPSFLHALIQSSAAPLVHPVDHALVFHIYQHLRICLLPTGRTSVVCLFPGKGGSSGPPCQRCG